MIKARDELWVDQTLLAVDYTKDLSLEDLDGCSFQPIYTDATPALKTFVDADIDVVGNTITKAAHGFPTGLKVALSNAGGALPAGTSATNYWLIAVDATTLKLATSLINALAGTPVDITAAAGGGTHTLTPATLGGVVVKLSASNDGTNFADLSSMTVTITAAGNQMWNIVDPMYKTIRLSHAASAGAINLGVRLYGKDAKRG